MRGDIGCSGIENDLAVPIQSKKIQRLGYEFKKWGLIYKVDYQ
jgi:hypothetical protein